MSNDDSADDSSRAGARSIEESLRRAAAERETERRQELDAAAALLQDPRGAAAQRAAYDATLPEMLALPTKEIPWPSGEPLLGLHRAMDHARSAEARRVEIERRFSGILELDWIFSLKRHALATLHAYRVWRAQPEPEGSFAQLLARAADLRSRFAGDAVPLLMRNLLDKQRVRHFDGGTTPENIACDLFLLTGVLEDVHPRVQGKVAFTPLELMEGAVMARMLLRAALVADRTTLQWQPADLYARAYALADRAYFETELALAELHNEDDAAFPWRPTCVFCESSRLHMQRHHRRHETRQASARRAAFVTATLTAAIRGNTVEN